MAYGPTVIFRKKALFWVFSQEAIFWGRPQGWIYFSCLRHSREQNIFELFPQAKRDRGNTKLTANSVKSMLNEFWNTKSVGFSLENLKILTTSHPPAQRSQTHENMWRQVSHVCVFTSSKQPFALAKTTAKRISFVRPNQDNMSLIETYYLHAREPTWGTIVMHDK